MPSYGSNLTADRAGNRDVKIGAEHSWRAWYKSPTWKAIKRHRLIQERNCRHCSQEGRTVIATHVDHVEPHRGQWPRFANMRTLKASALAITTHIGDQEGLRSRDLPVDCKLEPPLWPRVNIGQYERYLPCVL